MVLVALTVALLLLAAVGVDAAPAGLVSAVKDAAVALYVVQLVGVSFFNDTAELRFAAAPGLLLVGLSLTAAAIVAARVTSGSSRRKMRVARAIAIPYALAMGLAALFVPLNLDAPGLGSGIAVTPPPAAAFLFPLAWGLLFASLGGLIGAFGREWRSAASRQLGVWAAPLASSLVALAASLVGAAALALVGGLSIVNWDLGAITGGGLGHAIRVLGAFVLALPTLAAGVLVAGFTVPFDWQLDMLSQGSGSVGAFGGALPHSGAHPAGGPGAPAVLALAPLLALAGVFAVGWLSARRSRSDVRLGFANATRAAMLTTLVVWLVALLARVDVQAGGLLGFHLAPDTAALLWRVPLVAFIGCFAGSFAYALSRGASARRQLAAALASTLHPSSWGAGSQGPNRPGRDGQSLTWRAALGLGFVAVPLMLVGTGATGTATSAGPAKVSLAPIARSAEQVLERASANDEAVAVSVDPETRVVGAASVQTPLYALGIAAGESRVGKAEDVLDHYGELFGLPDPASELADAQVSTDELGMTHVSFTQVANGLPVYAGAIGVHLKGERLIFLGGSVIPNVSVAEAKAKLSRRQAIEVAKGALPSGTLAESPSLQIYAGLPPYTSGTHARLAWPVWLISEDDQESNEYVVDAVSGEILDTVPKGSGALDREVFDAEGQAELPGTFVRGEGDPETGDADSDAAYEHTDDVYTFYYEQSGIDSYNGEGAPLISSVHVGEPSGAPLENAYWDGKEQLVFGDGFPQALDVVGHELTHAYTQFSSGLVGTGQPGALNESISDIQGATIEMAETEEVNWEIGEGLPNELGPIRSLSEPWIFGDPASLAEWIEDCLDNFSIHANSTVTSHAFYLAATSAGPEPSIEDVKSFALIFKLGFMDMLTGNPTASLEDARLTTVTLANEYLEPEKAAAVVNAFDEVGLNGTAQPPVIDCDGEVDCSFALALKNRQNLTGDDAAAMLSTLYKARGELALGSAAGDHFLPLYEQHMGRVSELVSEDPELAEMAVAGLEEVTPALEGLIEGEGEEFELTPAQMAKIEAALERLAEDDRLYGGPDAGELADLIEDELEWMGLPSYGGMDYEAGFSHLNKEVEAQSLMEETGVITDPNCTGLQNGGYPNNFHINGFWVDTPDHRIPGQVSPLNAGGIICGAEVEETTGKSGCVGEGSLNTAVTVQLPPGDKVKSSKSLTNRSWVGETIGRAIACAGDETKILYGQAGLLSLASWEAWQCPTTAISCYEGRTKYQPPEGEAVIGRAYAWVSEEGGELTMTTRPVVVVSQGYEVQASFGQFEVKLCGRAGGVEAQECGGPSAPWVHQNGEAGEAGCPEGKGLYTARAENALGQKTLPASSCVRWEQGAQMQTVGAPNGLRAVSCVPGTSTCVAADSKGNAFYATSVSASSPATWTSWSGPGVSPAHAVECPSATLCLLAAGEVGGGGNLYRASSLGGSFLTSFKPADGVGAISCPSTSFCVTTLEGGGFIRYATNPAGIVWTTLSIGSGAMRDVSCLSTSFCAVVDGTGNVHVATTEKRVKEAPGWTATNVNGATALDAIACSSTTSCLAVDGSDEVLKLTIKQPSGEAEVARQALDGAAELTEVTCTGSDCVAVDDEGGVFASADAGASWAKRFAAAGEITSVSCASAALCASVDTSGDVAMFDPE